MVAVGVVLGGGAEADLDVGVADAAGVLSGECTEGGGHRELIGIRDGVGEEVGARASGGEGGEGVVEWTGRERAGGGVCGLRGCGFGGGGLGGGAELLHGARELGLHGVEQDGVGLGGGSG